MKSDNFEDWAQKFDIILNMISQGKMGAHVLLEHCYKDYNTVWNSKE